MENNIKIAEISMLFNEHPIDPMKYGQDYIYHANSTHFSNVPRSEPLPHHAIVLLNR